MGLDFLNVSDIDVKNNLNAINTWLISGNIFNEHVINNIMLFTVAFDDRIMDVDIYISKDKKEFSFILYMSRWNLFWHSKKVYNNLKQALSQYLIDKKIKINFAIFKSKEVVDE